MKGKRLKTFSLDDESIEMLRELSKKNKKTMSAYICDLIRSDFNSGPIINAVKGVMNNLSGDMLLGEKSSI